LVAVMCYTSGSSVTWLRNCRSCRINMVLLPSVKYIVALHWLAFYFIV